MTDLLNIQTRETKEWKEKSTELQPYVIKV
jgi:hypothetical protein